MSFSRSVENLRCIYIYYIARFSDILFKFWDSLFLYWDLCVNGNLAQVPLEAKSTYFYLLPQDIDNHLDNTWPPLGLDFFLCVFLIKVSARGEHCNQVLVWSQINSGKRISVRLGQVFFLVMFVSDLKYIFVQGTVAVFSFHGYCCATRFLFGRRVEHHHIWTLCKQLWVKFGIRKITFDNLLSLHVLHWETSRSKCWDLCTPAAVPKKEDLWAGDRWNLIRWRVTALFLQPRWTLS